MPECAPHLFDEMSLRAITSGPASAKFSQCRFPGRRMSNSASHALAFHRDDMPMKTSVGKGRMPIIGHPASRVCGAIPAEHALFAFPTAIAALPVPWNPNALLSECVPLVHVELPNCTPGWPPPMHASYHKHLRMQHIHPRDGQPQSTHMPQRPCEQAASEHAHAHGPCNARAQPIVLVHAMHAGEAAYDPATSNLREPSGSGPKSGSVRSMPSSFTTT